VLGEARSPVIYSAPERVVTTGASRAHAKSASRCPAVINMESRYFQITAPFDMNIGLERDAENKPVLKNMSGGKSPIRGNKLGQEVALVAEVEWRFPDRPIFQLKLPYIFLADEPVYVTQIAPFLHYRPQPLPGTIFGGRFPIDVWPRPLMWAFEWWDVSQPLVIKRGEPLFYLQFEGDHPERSVQLVEAEMTDDLRTYLDHISGAVNYVNQTFSLFREAERVRPTKLLKAVDRQR
jgi:hypothetical protein